MPIILIRLTETEYRKMMAIRIELWGVKSVPCVGLGDPLKDALNFAGWLGKGMRGAAYPFQLVRIKYLNNDNNINNFEYSLLKAMNLIPMMMIIILPLPQELLLVLRRSQPSR